MFHKHNLLFLGCVLNLNYRMKSRKQMMKASQIKIRRQLMFKTCSIKQMEPLETII